MKAPAYWWAVLAVVRPVCAFLGESLGPRTSGFLGPLSFSAGPLQNRSPSFSFKSGFLSATHVLNGQEFEGKLKPLRNYLILEKKPEHRQSKGGVLLPTDVRDQQIIGRVLAVGDGNISLTTGEKVATGLNASDWVMYNKESGEPIKYDGLDCIILSAEEILAKVSGQDVLNPQDITPLSDAVLVRIKKQSNVTDGGLVLASSLRQKSHVQGQVVSVGPGQFIESLDKNTDLEVAPGDSVLFSSYAQDPIELKMNQEVYTFVRGHDIIAKW